MLTTNKTAQVLPMGKAYDRWDVRNLDERFVETDVTRPALRSSPNDRSDSTFSVANNLNVSSNNILKPTNTKHVYNVDWTNPPMLSLLSKTCYGCYGCCSIDRLGLGGLCWADQAEASLRCRSEDVPHVGMDIGTFYSSWVSYNRTTYPH